MIAKVKTREEKLEPDMVVGGRQKNGADLAQASPGEGEGKKRPEMTV